MATFPPIITTNTASPALVVTVADPGTGVTYEQVKNSLGQYVYMVQGFYIQADTLNQLIGPVKYLRYDAGGNQIVTNITTTVDPYQDQKTIIVDLANFETDVILNGNSSVQFNVLPNERMQLKLYMRRITSSFGRNLDNFLVQEKIANKPGFFDNYGNLFRIAQDNYLAQESATLGVGDTQVQAHRSAVLQTGDETAGPIMEASPVPKIVENLDVKPVKAVPKEDDNNYGMIFIGIAVFSIAGYLAQKNKK